MTDLQAFIAQQLQEKPSEPPVDWERRKNRWIDFVNELYSQVQDMLLKSGLKESDFRRVPKTITEEKLGTYSVDALEASVGTRVVRFDPVGTLIIGGYGRVDVVGPTGEKVKFIADDADEREPEDQTPSYERNWNWRIYPERSYRDFWDFNEQGLLNTLNKVLGAK